jgi:hypothetical protein
LFGEDTEPHHRYQRFALKLVRLLRTSIADEMREDHQAPGTRRVNG